MVLTTSGSLYSTCPTTIISQDLVNLHNCKISELITNLGQDCTLQSPAELIECTNCIYDPISKRSTGIYKTGGPRPFTKGVCPHCRGIGREDSKTESTIRCVVIWNPKEWIDILPEVMDWKVPRNMIQLWGYYSDVPALLEADTIIVAKDLRDIVKYVCRRVGQPVPKGFAIPSNDQLFFMQRVELIKA